MAFQQVISPCRNALWRSDGSTRRVWMKSGLTLSRSISSTTALLLLTPVSTKLGEGHMIKAQGSKGKTNRPIGTVCVAFLFG